MSYKYLCFRKPMMNARGTAADKPIDVMKANNVNTKKTIANKNCKDKVGEDKIPERKGKIGSLKELQQSSPKHKGGLDAQSCDGTKEREKCSPRRREEVQGTPKGTNRPSRNPQLILFSLTFS